MKNKSIVVAQNRRFEIESNPIPYITQNQVLIEILHAGICGTDMQFINGSRRIESNILGHEGVGRLIQIGESLSNQFNIGDIVTFLPHSVETPDCILGHNISGLFANFIVLEANQAKELIVPCQTNTKRNLLVLSEPLASVVFSIDLLSMSDEIKRFGIIGLGTIGALSAITVSIMYPTADIYCFHNNDEKVKWIRENNLINTDKIHFVNIKDHTTIDGLLNTLESTVVCTSKSGSKSGLSLAVKITKNGGVIDLLSGYQQDCIEIHETTFNTKHIRSQNICEDANSPPISKQVQDKTLFLRGHRGISKQHMLRSIALLEAHCDSFSKVISTNYSPIEAVDFFNHHVNTSANSMLRNNKLKMVINF